MLLNFDHPAFDLSLELLAMLPIGKASVRKRDLQDDLRLSGERELNDLIARLRNKGFAVCAANTEAGRVVFVQPHGWDEASEAALEYHQTVYGD